MVCVAAGAVLQCLMRCACTCASCASSPRPQAAISEGATLNYASEEVKQLRNLYTYRAYIALGSHNVVLTEVSADAKGPEGAVRHLAAYMADRESNRASALEAVRGWMVGSADDTTCVVAATILSHEKDHEGALGFVRNNKSLPQYDTLCRFLVWLAGCPAGCSPWFVHHQACDGRANPDRHGPR